VINGLRSFQHACVNIESLSSDSVFRKAVRSAAMDVSKILPNLYVGSHPACKSDIDGLKDAGITAVLNVQTDNDFRYLGSDWPSQRAYYFAQRLEIRRVPIRDFDEDALRDNLSRAVGALHRLLQEGHVVFVHCTAGANRAPTVVIAYLHWVRQRSLEEAEQFVQGRHPCMPVTGVIRLAAWDGRRVTV